MCLLNILQSASLIRKQQCTASIWKTNPTSTVRTLTSPGAFYGFHLAIQLTPAVLNADIALKDPNDLFKGQTIKACISNKSPFLQAIGFGCTDSINLRQWYRSSKNLFSSQNRYELHICLLKFKTNVNANQKARAYGKQNILYNFYPNRGDSGKYLWGGRIKIKASHSRRLDPQTK